MGDTVVGEVAGDGEGGGEGSGLDIAGAVDVGLEEVNEGVGDACEYDAFGVAIGDNLAGEFVDVGCELMGQKVVNGEMHREERVVTGGGLTSSSFRNLNAIPSRSLIGNATSSSTSFHSPLLTKANIALRYGSSISTAIDLHSSFHMSLLSLSDNRRLE